MLLISVLCVIITGAAGQTGDPGCSALTDSMPVDCSPAPPTCLERLQGNESLQPLRPPLQK